MSTGTTHKIWTYPDGTRTEEWYRDDGLVCICTYRDGKLHHDDGPPAAPAYDEIEQLRAEVRAHRAAWERGPEPWESDAVWQMAEDSGLFTRRTPDPEWVAEWGDDEPCYQWVWLVPEADRLPPPDDWTTPIITPAVLREDAP